MTKETGSLPHKLLFPLGALYSLSMALKSKLELNNNAVLRYWFLPCNYSVISLMLLGSIFASRNKPLSKYHKIHGCIFIFCCVYMMISRLFDDLSIFLSRISIFAQHYTFMYFLCGSIFAWEHLPFISILSKELSPNTHWDFKLGYLLLNISIYCTHTYSLHFFNSQLELPVSDYGYFGCMSIFYVANTVIGPFAERHKATKKATLLLSFVSASLYSLFIVIRLFKNTFGGLFTICSLFSLYVIVLSPIFPLYDVLVLNHLAKKYKELELCERKEIFTRIRMWASIGHAISGVVITYIHKTLDTTGSSAKEETSLLFFILISVVIVCTSIFISIVHTSLEEKTDVTETLYKSKKTEKVLDSKEVSAGKSKEQNLLKNGNFLFLLFVITSVGVTRAVSSHYLVTYLSVYFGLKFSKVTSILCIRTFSEMCILYYSKHLLKYFGYYWLLFFSLLAATLREFNYAHLPTSNTIIFATLNEVFKGISSSCLIFSAVNIVDELADKNNKATAQTFYSGFYNGVAILLSSLISLGIIRYFKDLRSLFHVSSTIGFICCSIVVIKYGIIDKKLQFRKQISLK